MRYRTYCNRDMRVLDMRSLPSVDALVFRVRCGWYDVVGEGNFGLATRAFATNRPVHRRPGTGNEGGLATDAPFWAPSPR